ncbi:hypothetical protein [Natronoglomus mannanivorans]|uniref:Uncharacterized protein n=1 Tax=Natronoglomus mannanivorans TaxID=2979990 RepID=A0AAP3E3X9_9EURY|nr:hypothetical protein [Halobacteria archaeon AArc-xg1-1]
MSAETADVLEDVFTVDEGDQVRIATNYYEWSRPMDVDDVEHVEWAGATGGSWSTREVTIESSHGTTFDIIAVEGDAHAEMCRRRDGERRGDVNRFEILDVPDECWCGVCGHGPTTEQGIKIHHGRSHEGDPQVLSEAPDTDALEDGQADDAPEDTGDDVQVDANDNDGDQITVDSVSDPGDDVGVELPGDVTPEDVDDLTSGGIELGELAHELGVHPNRARSIAHGLGFYARVREVINRPLGEESGDSQ